MIIMLLSYSLWREVERSATKSASEERGTNRPSEVTNFNNSFLIKYILWFYISVDDLVKVEVVDSFTELFSDYPHCLLAERMFPVEKCVKLSREAQFLN